MDNFKFFPEGWRDNNKLLETQEIFQGFVDECDSDYNLHITLENGEKGVIPREEVEEINLEKDGLPKTNLCVGKVHKFVQFKKVGNYEDKLLLSRRQVQKEVVETIKTELQVGQTLNAIVKNITPYGAFLDIGGGVVGLVHIEDLSVARIKSPFERIKIGQKVNVMVKYIDKDTGRINLSYKETLGSWEENAKQFGVGMKVKGIIRETEKNKNGIFIELKPNLVGMAEYQDGLDYGENVNVIVKKIDYDKKKVKLIIL